MKTLCFIICALIGVSQQINIRKIVADFEDAIDKNAKDCYKEFNLDRQEIDRMIAGKLPNDRNLKCVFHCVFVHLNIFDEAASTFTENAKKYYEVDKPTADLIFNKCNDLKGEDNCEKTFHAINCVYQMLEGLP
ncbi:hypothetical protein FQA39_LY13761 [Lamprigera yunnana]|nr:hypothetical protein FQA39_LY13761 [Lamprigera yunnana]